MSPLWVPQAPVPKPYLAPTGAAYETFPRNGFGNANINQATGVLWLAAVALPVGLSVGHICFTSGTTLAGTPTHWWFGLYNSSRVQLATTADQTTTAWAATTAKNLAVATIASGASSTFVTTYTGLHYVGFMMTATTPCNLAGATLIAGVYAQTPRIVGNSDTAQTTPPAFAHTAAALTAQGGLPYAWVGP